MECKFEIDGICVNDQCPMCADCCPVPDVEGVCQHEAREGVDYGLTPKGCAVAAFIHAGLDLHMECFDGFWDEFVRLMDREGYVREEADADELEK